MMTNQLQVFNNEDFGEIRTVIQNGVIWFVAADICRVLDIQNVTQAVSRLKENERAMFNIGRSPIHGGGGETNCVNEPGLYRLIFASRKPEAEKFQNWVYHEVLPSIRKTGAYSTQPMANVDKDFALYKVVRDVGKTAETLQQYFDVSKGISLATATAMIEDIFKLDLTPLKKLIPPAEHEIGTLTPTEIGKQMNLSPRKVNEKLVEKGLQVKDGKDYRLTDEGKKYAESMPYTRNGHSGYQIKWTPETVTVLLEYIVQ